jgi:hypothetical protein
MLVERNGVLNCIFLLSLTNLSLFSLLYYRFFEKFLKVCFSPVMGWVEVLAMPEVRSVACFAMKFTSTAAPS